MKSLKEIKRQGTGSLYLGPVKNANTKSVTYNSFGKVVKESLNDKKVPVYHAPDKRGEYELVGHVHRSATSIKAAKLAGKKSARFEKVDGKYGWIAEGILDKVTHSPEDLAKKHNVSLEHINAQLDKGIKVEQEHTSNLDVAREIALDHLGEDPNYYFKLKKMEEAVDPKKLRYNKYANKFVKKHGNLFWNPDKPTGNTKVQESSHTTYNIHGEATNKEGTSHDRVQYAVVAKSRKHALNKGLKQLQRIFPDHNSHEVTLHEEVKQHDQVTINYGAHAKESHRVTMLHGDGEVTIQPDKRRGRENRYPGGELKVPQTDLHKMNELHDEPERLGAGMRGISGTEGMNVTEEPRKTLKLSKSEWDHHTRHATAQYDHEGKPWIVKRDPSGAAIRIPVTISEDYPHRETIRKVLKEALPQPTPPQEKPESKTAKAVKGVVKKEKDGGDANTKLTFGKTKDKFEPDPVLTPVLSIANMPGGSVR